MYEHHQTIIDRLTDRFADDPLFPALIVGGSVAKGRARPDSDVDIVLVTTEDEWRRREAAADFWYAAKETVDDRTVFVDGKVYGLSFLEEVAARGSEPARAAFSHTIVPYSRIAGLEETLRRIRKYPEADREAKMRSFYSQVALLGRFFVGEAAKRNDPYLMGHSVSNMVLYGCRLVLAYNRVLYPYHKWLMWEVERVGEKPDGFLDAIRNALAHPGVETAEAFCKCLDGWRDWGVTMDEAVNLFMVDDEWNWRTGATPISDR